MTSFCCCLLEHVICLILPDPLLNRGMMLCNNLNCNAFLQKLISAGVDVQMEAYPDMVHSFHLLAHLGVENVVNDAVERLALFLANVFS